MEYLKSFLETSLNAPTQRQRLTAILGGEEKAVLGLTVGEMVYDYVSIDKNALEAFDFVRPVNQNDIYQLATWSHGILGQSQPSVEGHLNRLQGYVFERLAALSLRHAGAVVEFPDDPSNRGWDFLVNGEKVQAKCGISPEMVEEHFKKYPGIPRVVVNEDLYNHFIDNDYVTAIHGVTRDAVRSVTEQSLEGASDLLDPHIIEMVPPMAILRSTYHWWRGETDLTAMATNLPADWAGRSIGVVCGHAVGRIVALGLGGWPAILLPAFVQVAGYRAGRLASDWFKHEVLLRSEVNQVRIALSEWCSGVVRVLSEMLERAERIGSRLLAQSEGAHQDWKFLFDDWARRLEKEQATRRFYLARFQQGITEPWVFRERGSISDACANAIVVASRAGVLTADLVKEKQALSDALMRYQSALSSRA
jgi:hypothetical protein